jgi:SAM-dependent methyltransferase
VKLLPIDGAYDDPFGGSPERLAQYEYRLALDLTLPFLDGWGVGVHGKRVLDLGCGAGGLSVALAETGAQCVGVDLQEELIAAALQMAAEHGVAVRFLVGDILTMGSLGKFDLVILSEVVEHLVTLSNVEALIRWCREHLAPQGTLYVSFPPWLNPFAGHQAGWPRIRFIPWYHLLPERLKRLLAPEEAPDYLRYSEEFNHLTVGAFEKTVRQVGLTIDRRELYLLRPEYYYRYGIPALRLPFLAGVPLVQEVATMGAYYLLGNG